MRRTACWRASLLSGDACAYSAIALVMIQEGVVVRAVLAAPHAGDALFHSSGGLLLKGLSVSCRVFKLLPVVHHGNSYARRE